MCQRHAQSVIKSHNHRNFIVLQVFYLVAIMNYIHPKSCIWNHFCTSKDKTPIASGPRPPASEIHYQISFPLSVPHLFKSLDPPLKWMLLKSEKAMYIACTCSIKTCTSLH